MRLLPIVCSFMLLAGSAMASPPASDVAVEPDAAAAKEAEAAKPDAARKDERHCLRETGSRIKRKDQNACLPLAGRSYSRDDLDSTGAVTAGEALSRLDPAISRGH